jgi:hypothetical protein
MRRIRFAAVTAVVASIVGLGMATPAPAAPAVQSEAASPALQVAAAGGDRAVRDYVAWRDARRRDAKGQAGIQQVECFNVYTYLLSKANSRFVSAEVGYTGSRQNMLRARATTVDDWELFIPCFDENYDYLYSVGAQRYVSAEVGYGGSYYAMLRARATVPDLWERFIIGCDRFCFVQSAENGLLTSAELGYPGGDYGMLRARSGVFDLWEQFL